MDKKASQTSRRAISAGCNIISKEIAQASRWNSNLFEPLGELFEFPTRQAIDLLILFAAEDLAREIVNWLLFEDLARKIVDILLSEDYSSRDDQLIAT